MPCPQIAPGSAYKIYKSKSLPYTICLTNCTFLEIVLPTICGAVFLTAGDVVSALPKSVKCFRIEVMRVTKSDPCTVETQSTTNSDKICARCSISGSVRSKRAASGGTHHLVLRPHLCVASTWYERTDVFSELIRFANCGSGEVTFLIGIVTIQPFGFRRLNDYVPASSLTSWLPTSVMEKRLKRVV